MINQRLQYIQISRGLAALIVVLHHISASSGFYYSYTPFNNFFSSGWNGVDFFFVLSGFIIYYIHSNDLGRPERLTYYLLKRIFRIYPVYWIIASVGLIMLLVSSSNITRASLQGNLLDFEFILKSYLLIPQSKHPFLSVAWSLCFEVFFYILFGMAILLGRKTLWSLLFVHFILIIASYFVSISNSTYFFEFITSNYHIEFLAGVVTAWIFKNNLNNVYGRKDTVFLFFGIILFMSAWSLTLIWQDLFSKSTIASRLIFGVASCLIILGIAKKQINKYSSLTRFFLTLGDASYVLYLIHPIVLAVLFKTISKVNVNNITPLYIYLIGAMALLICILASILFHKIIEVRILSFLQRQLKDKRNQ